eukprot:Clim_evm9s161 gene=Clim_evmTU9s161
MEADSSGSGPGHQQDSGDVPPPRRLDDLRAVGGSNTSLDNFGSNEQLIPTPSQSPPPARPPRPPRPERASPERPERKSPDMYFEQTDSDYAVPQNERKQAAYINEPLRQTTGPMDMTDSEGLGLRYNGALDQEESYEAWANHGTMRTVAAATPLSVDEGGGSSSSDYVSEEASKYGSYVELVKHSAEGTNGKGSLTSMDNMMNGKSSDVNGSNANQKSSLQYVTGAGAAAVGAGAVMGASSGTEALLAGDSIPPGSALERDTSAIAAGGVSGEMAVVVDRDDDAWENGEYRGLAGPPSMMNWPEPHGSINMVGNSVKLTKSRAENGHQITEMSSSNVYSTIFFFLNFFIIGMFFILYPLWYPGNEVYRYNTDCSCVRASIEYVGVMSAFNFFGLGLILLSLLVMAHSRRVVVEFDEVSGNIVIHHGGLFGTKTAWAKKLAVHLNREDVDDIYIRRKGGRKSFYMYIRTKNGERHNISAVALRSKDDHYGMLLCGLLFRKAMRLPRTPS